MARRRSDLSTSRAFASRPPPPRPSARARSRHSLSLCPIASTARSVPLTRPRPPSAFSPLALSLHVRSPHIFSASARNAWASRPPEPLGHRLCGSARQRVSALHLCPTARESSPPTSTGSLFGFPTLALHLCLDRAGIISTNTQAPSSAFPRSLSTSASTARESSPPAPSGLPVHRGHDRRRPAAG